MFVLRRLAPLSALSFLFVAPASGATIARPGAGASSIDEAAALLSARGRIAETFCDQGSCGAPASLVEGSTLDVAVGGLPGLFAGPEAVISALATPPVVATPSAVVLMLSSLFMLGVLTRLRAARRR
ncbi:MAG: hypothetical protein ACK5MQ_06620 [Pikeienuella sp.]